MTSYSILDLGRKLKLVSAESGHMTRFNMGSNERRKRRNNESGKSKQESRNEAGKLELGKLIF